MVSLRQNHCECHQFEIHLQIYYMESINQIHDLEIAIRKFEYMLHCRETFRSFTCNNPSIESLNLLHAAARPPSTAHSLNHELLTPLTRDASTHQLMRLLREAQ